MHEMPIVSPPPRLGKSDRRFRLSECLCPVCATPMPRRKIAVDLEWNRVAFDGQLLDLTGTEAEIVHLLEAERPKLVSMEMMRRRVFVNEITDSRVYTHMGRVKEKLAAIGLGVRLHAGYGWRLEILPEVALA